MGSLPCAELAVPVRRGEHACCRFAQAGDRERLALAFVRDGLRRGDKVLYLCDSEDIAPVLTRLERLDPGFGAAIAGGQFEIRRASDAYMPDGQFEPDRMLGTLRGEYERARAEGYAGLSMTGEIPVAVCEAPGGKQLPVFEARLASEHPEQVRLDSGSCSILCHYDHARFGPGILADVVRTHEVDASPELAAIGRDSELAAARDRKHHALRFCGELDFGSAETVSDVLEAHFHGPLRVDLADLRFVDVAGMRALRGRRGQRLTIAPASPAVRRLLALLAWDTDTDVEVLEAG